MRISFWRPAGTALVAIGASLLIPAAASADAPPTARIRVVPAPYAQFVPVGQPVAFVDRSTDADGRIVRRAWDADDDGVFGEHIDQVRFRRSFAMARCVVVRLRVTDNGGNISEAVVGLTVFAIGQLPTACPPPAPPPPPFVNSPPRSVFSFAPAAPRVGEAVNFVSGATDPDGPVGGEAWDLDGDGAFDDAIGPMARYTYPTPGPRTVSLRVVDGANVPAIASQIVTVGAATSVPAPGPQPTPQPTPQPQPDPPERQVLPDRRREPTPLLTGIVVRIRGEARSTRVRVARLSVQAPRGSTIRVRCAGRGCPSRETTSLSRSARSVVRFPRFERSLRVGIVIRILVTRSGRIGKYTRFALLANRSPSRADQCVRHGRTKPFPCPDDEA
jgi:hypothetical protein